jgi:hypothetical protein
MILRSLVIVVLLAVAAGTGRAQFSRGGGTYIGPGSTVQGDYLRGLGIAAVGAGVYNLDTAMANSINTDTMIRLNEYLAGVAKQENLANAQHRAWLLAKNRENYDKVRRRIMENPEARDVQNGDALNAVLVQLQDPTIDESSFRFSPVPLSIDVVRRIPFKLDSQGIRFSFERLSTRGKGKWPIALQDRRFAEDRRAYERALDDALEQQIEGKMSLEAISALEKTVNNLAERLDSLVKPSGDKLYIESRDRLKELRESTQLLKSEKIQLALGELDRYSGTTVNDLKVFMVKFKLGFDVARTPDERKLYPELYTSLVQQRENVTGQAKPPGK